MSELQSSGVRNGLLALIAFLFLLTGIANAEAATGLDCDGNPKRAVPEGTDLLAMPSSIPFPVTAGLFVKDLRDVDAVTDSFRFRGVIRVTWCDPRQAFDPAAAGVDEKQFFGPDAEKIRATSLWSPRGFPVNQVDSFQITEQSLRIDHTGQVTAAINLTVRLSSPFDLRRFPFDTQLLRFHIESFTFNEEQVVFVADNSMTGFAENFQIPEWTITDVRAHVDSVDVSRSSKPHSRLVLTIEIDRQSGFYVWKVLLPLLIIVALSWSVFWMPEEKFGIRVRTTATGILTIVAYQFVAGQALPRLGYLTLMDKIMVGSFVLLGVTVLESYLVSRYPEEERDKAFRVDRTARWLFPLAYASMIAFVSVTA
jgi:hypothetical protein